jgi:hypothetical protein
LHDGKLYLARVAITEFISKGHYTQAAKCLRPWRAPSEKNSPYDVALPFIGHVVQEEVSEADAELVAKSIGDAFFSNPTLSLFKEPQEDLEYPEEDELAKAVLE